jgi:hypothetical protein
MALRLAQAPENVDKTLWLYELCRLLTQKVNSIIVALFSDSPPCSSLTCPEMRASEWQYLCAVHDPPKSCCAIDYCCHTLDWAANTLTSPKHFPSRLALGTDQSTHHSQQRQLTNIFRRVYRIFAHAWFQHRDMFWKVEGRTGLYVFYKTVCDVYNLITEENYTVPAEAEGIERAAESRSSILPQILKREPSNPGPQDDGSTINESMSDHSLSTAGTTKRHRHSPSVGATSVHTVVEENEEEEERPALQSRPATQIFGSVEEDNDTTVIEDSQTSNNEAEADVEETAPASEATQATGQAQKQSASDEIAKPQGDEKQVEEVDPDAPTDKTSENGSLGAKAADAQVTEDKSTTAGSDDKPTDKESEKAEQSEPSDEAEAKGDKDDK